MSLSVAQVSAARIKTRPVPAQRAVAELAAHIKKVQSRLTEELRIEDGVRGLVLKGGKVEVTIQRPGPFEPARVEHWVQQELRNRGVLLPVVFL